MADVTYLGANVYERDTTTPALPEYAVHEAAGVRVGVIGVVPEDTPDMGTPSGVAGLDFGDPVEAVNRVAAQLTDGDETNGEADIIVAEYHEGSPTSVGLTEAKASELFVRILEETSPEVDVIFNGHTHQLYQWDGPNGEKGTRVVSQSGSYGSHLGVIQLGYNTETGEVDEYIASNIATPPNTQAPSDACLEDPTWRAAAAIVDAAVANAKEKGLVPVAEISADITTALKDATVVDGLYTGSVRDNRLRESSLGNLVANAWLWAANEPGRPGADIGIMNPGGLRSDLWYAESGSEGDGVVTYLA